MTAPAKVSTAVISQAVAFVIPLLLGVYWAPMGMGFELKAVVLRGAMAVLGALLLIFWFRAPLTQAEITFAALFGLLAVLLIVPSLTATDPARAFKNAFKLVLLFAIGLAMARALRHGKTARAFGYAMLLGSALTAALVLYSYIGHMGLSLPTYQGLRVLKGALSKAGFPLNPVSFTTFFMYLIGLCLVPARPLTRCLGVFVFTVSSFLTGSRAPLAIMLASVLVATTLHLLRSRSLAMRVSGWVSVLLMTAAIAASLLMVDSRKMQTISEGRTDLWSLAWSKFLDRPLSGYGYESWRDDLSSRLVGGEYFRKSTITDGAYHNQYITLLAEEGLVGFIPAMVIMWKLLRCSCWLARRDWIPSINRYVIMLSCVFMLLRAGVEVPGLFGFANDPADYLAYCFLAVVVSRMSLDEDRRRLTGLRQPADQRCLFATSAAS